MYKLAIILRYLRSKLAPVFAILAVALCTAMVIIVISIMGGFLEMMQASTHTLEGDVIISRGLEGFGDYEGLLRDLRAADGLVASAAPTIQTFGLVKLADGLHTVEVIGIDPPSLDKVMDYRARLYWDPARVAAEPIPERYSLVPGEDEMLTGQFVRRRDDTDGLARRFDLRDLGMFPPPPAVAAPPIPGGPGAPGATSAPAAPIGPTARLTLDPAHVPSGAGHEVQADESASTPGAPTADNPHPEIVKYEIDWRGSGHFETLDDFSRWRSFSREGEYAATLRVTGNEGRSSTDTQHFYVGTAPAASAAPDPLAAWHHLQQWGQLAHSVAPKTPMPRDGMVIGIAVSRYHRRDSRGQYHLLDDMNLGREARLTVMPISADGVVREPSYRVLVVVNEFKSGLYQIDSERVYVPFALLQQMLHMDAYPAVDPDTGEPVKVLDPATGRPVQKMVPGKATHILVKAQPGQSLEQVSHGVEEIVERFWHEHHANTTAPYVETWRDKYATFLSAVANEKMLVTILFAIVSIVAFTMIAVVFYMIVLSKTRDIGTLRAMGAARTGIAGIFLGYGLAVGIIGSLLGLVLAAGVVNNINEIQTFTGTHLGEAIYYTAYVLGGAVLGTVLGWLIGARWRSAHPALAALLVLGLGTVLVLAGATTAHVILHRTPHLIDALNQRFGFEMWKPEIYYFDRIPSHLNPHEVAWIMLAAVISSVLGALIPAIRAARQNPVESLRYE